MARWGGHLYPSTSSISGSAVIPLSPWARHPPAIYLTAGEKTMARACFLIDLFMSGSAGSDPSGGVLKQTCPLTRLLDWRKMRKRALTTISEA